MRTPENLSSAEQRLLEAVRNGEPVDYTVGDPVRDDPAQGAAWDTERTIQASVIRALCVGAAILNGS
jgi:hypothetical protein